MIPPGNNAGSDPRRPLRPERAWPALAPSSAIALWSRTPRAARGAQSGHVTAVSGARAPTRIQSPSYPIRPRSQAATIRRNPTPASCSASQPGWYLIWIFGGYPRSPLSRPRAQYRDCSRPVFSGPLVEPDVRISTHPALHGRCCPAWTVAGHGVGILLVRQRYRVTRIAPMSRTRSRPHRSVATVRRV